MAATPIGFGNFSEISNQNLTFNLPNSSSDWIPTIIQTFNSVPFSNFIIMLLFTFITFIQLADNTQQGTIRFNDPKGIALAFGISSVMGITMLEIGFFTDIPSVAPFFGIFVLLALFVLKLENKE